MTADDRVERLLRHSADDVRAAIVITASPPPVGDFERGRGRPWAIIGSIVIVMAGFIGLFAVDHNPGDEVAPGPLSEPIATADQPLVTHPDAIEGLCVSVAEMTAELEPAPTATGSWQEVGDRLALLDDAAADPALNVDGQRRLDRFLVFARAAVERGENGEQLTAAAHAEEAVAVGRDLVDFLSLPTCTVTSSTPTLGPSEGGS